MATFTIGDVIDGKYELTAVLGEGDVGVVYAARRLHGEGRVALKLLLPSLRESRQAAARFLREALASMRLESEHVARVRDVGTFKGSPFLVMDHLDGRTLAAALRERGPLPVTEAVELLLHAADAVAEAHALGLVHRNLKPANLFLTRTADGVVRLKVLDVGLDRWSIADDASGTPSAGGVDGRRYVSPEQLTAPWRSDPRSDVWSLGAIFYELLAGKPAFASDADLFCGTYPELSSVRAGLPPAIEALLADAFARDRSLRLTTVAALAARLAPLGGETARALQARIEARSASVPASPEPAPDLEMPTAGTGGPDATLPVAPTVAGPTALTPPARKRRAVRSPALGALIVAGVAGAAFAWLHSSGATRDPATVNGRIEALNARCTGREAAACETLATLYAEGEGTEVPVDAQRRVEFEQAACEAGSAYSCTVVKRERELRSAETGMVLSNLMLERVCDKGSLDACAVLGSHWVMALGTPKDHAKGRTLLRKACNGGVVSACEDLAMWP